MAGASPQSRDASVASEPALPEHKSALRPKKSNHGTSSSLPPLASSPVAGVKRPAAALLPAFEPLSSSPGLPRPAKSRNTGNGLGATGEGSFKYPTPVPTSSTGILSSSPPRRPGFNRTMTAASEREPLAAVPTAELSENGDELLMGRSTNSSHFQLSANRHISRIHVKARYVAATSPLEPNKIEIICNGWNGIKLHCQGKTWELFKGDSFTSETEGTDIMLDALDARVMIQWPRRGADAMTNLSDSSWDDSPTQAPARANSLQSSPLRRTMRIQSPESPTPGHLSSSQRLQALFPSPESREESSIQIYEDEDEAEPELPSTGPGNVLDVNASMRTDATASFSSDLSDLGDDNDENDPNEENDPIVHSFGPFGANISGRFASISTRSPKAAKSPKSKGSPLGLNVLKSHIKPSADMLSSPLKALHGDNEPLIKYEPSIKDEVAVKSEMPSSPKMLPPPVQIDPSITNHVINQLAFSRLSSTPLPTIMQNLPDAEKQGLTKEVLRMAIESTPAIGIIKRQGKDAAGKALESEYYYIPETDSDEQRRLAVVDGLRKPSLRACRKQHKVSIHAMGS